MWRASAKLAFPHEEHLPFVTPQAAAGMREEAKRSGAGECKDLPLGGQGQRRPTRFLGGVKSAASHDYRCSPGVHEQFSSWHVYV